MSYGFNDVCTSAFDTSEFVASEMCLACGGGDTECVWNKASVKTYADLQGFENCTYIVGAIHLSQCKDCTDLLPLSNVSRIVPLDPRSFDVIRIDNNDALTSLEGLEQLFQGEFEGDYNSSESSISPVSFSNLATFEVT